MYGTDESIAAYLTRLRKVAEYQCVWLEALAPNLFVPQEKAKATVEVWRMVALRAGEACPKILRRAREQRDPSSATILQLDKSVSQLFRQHRVLLKREFRRLFYQGPNSQCDSDCAGEKPVRREDPPLPELRFYGDSLAVMGVLFHWWTALDSPDEWSALIKQDAARCSAVHVAEASLCLVTAFNDMLCAELERQTCWTLPDKSDELAGWLGNLRPRLSEQIGSLRTKGLLTSGQDLQLREASSLVFGAMWRYVPRAASKIFTTHELRWNSWPTMPPAELTPRNLWTAHLCIGYGVLEQLKRLIEVLRAPDALDDAAA